MSQYQEKRREIVDAVQVPIPTEVSTVHGTRYAQKGEWVVTYEDGHQEVYSDEAFKEIFEPVPTTKSVKS